MPKYTGKLFSDIKDLLDENELRQQRGIAERAADRTVRKDKIDAYLGRGTKTGNIGSRVDFSNDKMGPNFKTPAKPVKLTKKETSIETTPGNIGSLDRTSDVIGPNMSQINKETEKEIIAEESNKPLRELDAMQKAQNLMAPGYNKLKKGGVIKKMTKGGSVSSASKRADGCAMRGKTKGRII